MFFRKKTLLAKVESTYGTDATPGGTDAVLTRNLSIQPYAGPTVARNLNRSNLGGQEVINVNPQVQVTFEVEIAGAGTAGNAPAWAECLRACGFAESDPSPTGTSKIYTPVDSSFSSVTLYYFVDGQRHRIVGARGNVAFNMSREQIPYMTFTFTGQYETPTAASPSGVDTSDYVDPIPITNTNTPTYTMGGSPLIDLVAESFVLDMGNNVVARNVINSEEIMITDRNPTGSTIFEAVLPSTKDWFTDAVESHNGTSLQVVQLIHGTQSGNIVQFDLPAGQLTSIDENDSDGLLTYSAGLAALPVSGNDEITVTVY